MSSFVMNLKLFVQQMTFSHVLLMPSAEVFLNLLFNRILQTTDNNVARQHRRNW